MATYDDELHRLLCYMQGLEPGNTFYQPVRYILDHLPMLPAMSIYDLAEQCFVSTATISRLCKELGFQNFQDFKIRVYACYRHMAESTMPFPAYAVSREDAESPQIASALNYLDNCQKAMSHFIKFAHSSRFPAHMRLLQKAETVVLYSQMERNTHTLMRRLILCGKTFRHYFGELSGIAARCEADHTDWPHACTVAFLYAAEEYETLLPLFQSQRQQGASSILVGPDSLPVDTSLHDQTFTFPVVEAQRDELFFDLYLNSVMNAYF